MKNTLTILAAVAIESTALYLIIDNFFNYRLPMDLQIHYLQCLGVALLHWFYTIFLHAKEQREHYKIFLMERIALSLPTFPPTKRPRHEISDDSSK